MIDVNGNADYILAKALEPSVLQWQPTGLSGVEYCSWALSTKYYEATLEFWLVSSAASAETRTALLPNTQGVVLVLDGDSVNSLAEARGWGTFLDDAPAAVRLVIGQTNVSCEGLRGSDWHEAARDWCLEHRCEFIPFPEEDTKASTSLEARPLSQAGDMDDFGVVRVRDALRAVFWRATQPPGTRARQEAARREAALQTNFLPAKNQATGTIHQANPNKLSEDKVRVGSVPSELPRGLYLAPSGPVPRPSPALASLPPNVVVSIHHLFTFIRVRSELSCCRCGSQRGSSGKSLSIWF